MIMIRRNKSNLLSFSQFRFMPYELYFSVEYALALDLRWVGRECYEARYEIRPARRSSPTLGNLL